MLLSPVKSVCFFGVYVIISNFAHNFKTFDENFLLKCKLFFKKCKIR